MAAGVPYKIPKDLKYRCPDCVTKGKKHCIHQNRAKG